MAPTYIVQVFKSAFSLRPWTNDYLIDATDLDNAILQAGAIAEGERNLHHDVVRFERVRVSSLAEGDSVFSVVPLGTNGAVGSSGLDFLPMFNTMRVDFTVDGGGRPSRKYYRCAVSEEDQVAGRFESSAITTWQTRINGFVTFLGGEGVNWVDPQGSAITAGVLYDFVQMRQLHRKRRRKTTP